MKAQLITAGWADSQLEHLQTFDARHSGKALTLQPCKIACYVLGAPCPSIHMEMLGGKYNIYNPSLHVSLVQVW